MRYRLHELDDEQKALLSPESQQAALDAMNAFFRSHRILAAEGEPYQEVDDDEEVPQKAQAMAPGKWSFPPLGIEDAEPDATENLR